MLPTLIIKASDGTQKAKIECTTAEATFSRRQMDRATATIDDTDYAGVDIDPISDRLLIDRPDGTRLFGGRFDDDERDGATVRVTIASFRRDAIDAEPTGRSLTFQNVADTTVVQDAIDSVPTLSAGTLEELAPALSFEFPNSSRAKQIRKAAVATGAAVRYNPDRTVDYVERLGSDRSLTLSPANQNLVDGISVTEDVRDRVTHVRAFGSRELNLTRDAVTASYSGGRQVWRKFEDTDIRSEDRLQQIADRLATEYDGEPRELTVEATVVGEDLQRGDTVTVRLPDRDIDRTMTVTRLIERFGQRGRELVVTLKNRLVDDDATATGRESLQRFNRGYQGFVDRAQAGGDSRQPVSASIDSQTTVIYPDDVVREETARVLVEGLPYRAYSAGAANNPEFERATTAAEGGSIVSFDDDGSWVTLAATDPQGPASQSFVVAVNVFDSTTSIASRTLNVRLRFDFGNAGYWPEQTGIPLMKVGNGQNQNETMFAAPVSGNYTDLAQIEVQVQVNGNGNFTIECGAFADFLAEDVHTHPPDPGVVESFGGSEFYPSNCDVIVNGSSQGVSLGDGAGTFQEFVDISGDLTPGFNDIAVTSDSLGHVRATVETELFRKGP